MSNTTNNIEKLGFFFKQISWKKSLTFLFFLLLAIIFWGMHVYSQRLEIKLTIPLKYTHVADNILFEQELPTHIEVHIKDYGSSILKYATQGKDSLLIDLTAIVKDPTSQTTLQGQAYEQLIKSKILPSSELLSFSPAYISYAYNQVSTKRLPVLFDGFTNMPAGYQLDGNITIIPDSVLAYGTKAALDTLNFADTTKDTLNDIKESQKVKVPLKQTKGIEYKPQNIYLNIPVDKFIVKEVKVPVECINLPEDLSIKFFPSEVNMSFFVGLKRYNLIESNNFKVIVDYKDLEVAGNKSIPVKIIEAPDFVRTRLPEPSEVEYILEQE